MTQERLTIFVCGMIAGSPGLGGAAWAVLQYVLGLRQLGHEVVFIEPVPQSAWQPAGVAPMDSTNAAYFRQVVEELGLEASSALLVAGERRTVGLEYDQLRQKARDADLVLNVAGMLTDPELLEPIPRRVYLDLDPAFVQLWHATQGIDMRLEGHTHFVTVGLGIGQPDCAVPTCGRTWTTTLPPVVLTHWPAAGAIVRDALTTIGHWRGYGSIEHDGLFYGQKAHSLRQFLALPTLTDTTFELAMAIHPDERKDLDALAANGWRLLDPARVAASPADYQDLIRGSRAEFGIAKSGYVVSRCGWFSDRSACYLASGRPVIAQDTGFRRALPVGEGLFAFKTTEDVLDAINAMDSDYARHARAAREIAEDLFDSDRVLTRLLEQVGG